MSSFSFDSSVAGIFWPLFSGGTLVLPPERIEQDMEALAEIISSKQVTHTLLLPTLYAMLLDLADASRLESLQTVIVAGESCQPATAKRHFDNMPECSLYNEYGPTEATVWASVRKLDKGDLSGRVPIGKPIPGTRIYIMSGNHLSPQGAYGEICIAGNTVADGYVGSSEENTSFVPDPFTGTGRMYRTGDRARWRSDGVLEFLGRTDDQLKIRGYRVELEEVRRYHLTIPGINDAAIVAKPHDATGQLQLHAYVVSDALDSRAITARLKEVTPAHMVPSRITVVEKLPKLPNGKVDITALTRFDIKVDTDAGPSSVSPKNEIEEALYQVWKSVLGVGSFGVNDNFFELGGDSIMSIQVLSRLKAHGYNLSPNDIFSYQTIELLAMKAGRTEANATGRVEGAFELLPIQKWFFANHRTAPEHWNQVYRIELKEGSDAINIENALNELRRIHPALRSRFEFADGKWSGSVMKYDPLNIVIESGAEAVDMALAELNGQLDLSAGECLKCIYVEGNQTIYLIIHHLVVDAVSWQILFDDLDKLLQEPAIYEGTSPSDSIVRWSEDLWQTRPNEEDEELVYWRRQLRGSDMIKFDHSYEGTVTERDAETDIFELGSESVAKLMEVARQVYLIENDEIVLALVMLAVRKVMGGEDFTIMTELHGRESRGQIRPPGDMVGWFTSMFPVRLQFKPEPVVSDIITVVKDARRFVPEGGLGYGLAVESLGEALNHKGSGLLFNYLGSAQHSRERLSIAKVEPEFRYARSMDSERQFPLELNCGLGSNGQLYFRITFSVRHFKQDTIDSLKKALTWAFEQVVDYAKDHDEGTVSASDFPESGLSGDDLNTLLDSI